MIPSPMEDFIVFSAVAYSWFLALCLMALGVTFFYEFWLRPRLQDWLDRRRFNRMVRTPAVRISRLWTD